jgi:hypothetical protein
LISEGKKKVKKSVEIERSVEKVEDDCEGGGKTRKVRAGKTCIKVNDLRLFAVWSLPTQIYIEISKERKSLQAYEQYTTKMSSTCP